MSASIKIVRETRIMKKTDLSNGWRVHLPNLIKEIFKSQDVQILKIPLTTLTQILAKLAARAIELDDTKLNQLMMRLCLYEESDPCVKGYSEKKIIEYLDREVNHDSQ